MTLCHLLTEGLFFSIYAGWWIISYFIRYHTIFSKGVFYSNELLSKSLSGMLYGSVYLSCFMDYHPWHPAEQEIANALCTKSKFIPSGEKDCKCAVYKKQNHTQRRERLQMRCVRKASLYPVERKIANALCTKSKIIPSGEKECKCAVYE